MQVFQYRRTAFSAHTALDIRWGPQFAEVDRRVGGAGYVPATVQQEISVVARIEALADGAVTEHAEKRRGREAQMNSAASAFSGVRTHSSIRSRSLGFRTDPTSNDTSRRGLLSWGAISARFRTISSSFIKSVSESPGISASCQRLPLNRSKPGLPELAAKSLPRQWR